MAIRRNKRYGSVSHRIGRTAEHEALMKLKSKVRRGSARLTKASGALAEKGDLIYDVGGNVWAIESKATSAPVYRLNWHTLSKLYYDAVEYDKIPMLRISFNTKEGAGGVVVCLIPTSYIVGEEHVITANSINISKEWFNKMRGNTFYFERQPEIMWLVTTEKEAADYIRGDLDDQEEG